MKAIFYVFELVLQFNCRIYNVSATPKSLDQKGHEALNL